MFGRKPPTGNGETPQPVERVAPTPFQPQAQRPAQPAPIPARPVPATETDSPLPPRPSPVSAMSQPAGAPSQPARRPAEPVREVRKLVVGKEISLSGEIAACDHLIIEGTVEASVKDCHRLEVSETGLFRGGVDIGEADIAGRFEGQITVQGRLVVRSTGRIEGKIQYAELSVEAGGTIDGEVHVHGKTPTKPALKAAAVPPPAPLLDAVSAPTVEEPAGS